MNRRQLPLHNPASSSETIKHALQNAALGSFPARAKLFSAAQAQGARGLYLQTLERIMFRKILIANRGEIVVRINPHLPCTPC